MATAKRRKPTAPKPPVINPPATKKAAAPAPKRKPIAVKPRPSAKAQAEAKAAEKRAIKAAVKKQAVAGNGQSLNKYGFVPGTDSALIVDAMMSGGVSRIEVNEIAERMIEKQNGLLTRSNKTKNVPSLVSALLARLLERGFTVESKWVVHPPASIEAASDDSDDSDVSADEEAE